jgi:hypothetical protein
MPDFSHLYQRPAGRTPKPRALPADLYPGIISTYSFEEVNRPSMSSGKVPAVRINIKPTGWPDSVPESERFLVDEDNQKHEIDLTKSQFRTDFVTPEDFTDRSWYYFDEFLRSCGLEPDGHNYEELIAQLPGTRVSFEIQQYLNQRTNEIGNQVGRVFGSSGR